MIGRFRKRGFGGAPTASSAKVNAFAQMRKASSAVMNVYDCDLNEFVVAVILPGDLVVKNSFLSASELLSGHSLSLVLGNRGT